MSRHFIHMGHGERKITVVAGYDRPLQSLFLHVIYADLPPREEERFLYDSLDDPDADWTDINTLADRLETLGIAVPPSLIEGIFLDQCLNAGNRIVEHRADRPPIVHHAG